MNNETHSLFHQTIDEAQQVLLVMAPNATADMIGACLTLSDALIQRGKNVSVASPVPTSLLTDSSLRLSDFVGSDAIQNEIGNRDLQVSFPYEPGKVDKVNYQIDEETQQFHLTVAPQSGIEPLSSEDVSFSYIGVQADLVLLVGVHDYETLGEIYEEHADFFAQTRTMTLHRFAPNIGDIHLVVERSFVETIHELLQLVKADISSDMATNLLRGIEAVTDNLQSLTTKPETFELVAALLRAGARRRPKQRQTSSYDTPNQEEGRQGQVIASGASAVNGSNPFADALGKRQS